MFEAEARKFFLEILGDDPAHKEWIDFQNAIGDIKVRQGGKEALDQGLKAYSEANRIL